MDFQRSNRQNKKYQVTLDTGKTIHFGAKGYRIKPGTPAGDNYCTRSYGIKDKYGEPTRDDPESPNYWSRKAWNCRGKRSLK